MRMGLRGASHLVSRISVLHHIAALGDDSMAATHSTTRIVAPCSILPPPRGSLRPPAPQLI